MTLTSWLIQLTSGFSFMLISRTSAGRWVIGESQDAVWFDTDVPSIEAARMRYFRSGGTSSFSSRPVIEAGFYVVPDEFVPITRVSAQCHGTRYYVGSPCKHHPLNNIRSTSNKTCVVCELLKDYL